MLRKLFFIVLFLFSIALYGAILTALVSGAHASGRSYKSHAVTFKPFRLPPELKR
jgi:hypothetical protein